MFLYQIGFLLLAACAGPIQDASQKVTFETNATTADKVIQMLSAKTGIKFGADALMAKEVLVISVKDVPLQALLDRIAKVTSGKWFLVKDVYSLKPDRDLWAIQEKEAVQIRADILKKDAKRRNPKEPDVIVEENIPTFALVPAGQRVVLSATPNRMQSAFSGTLPGELPVNRQTTSGVRVVNGQVLRTVESNLPSYSSDSLLCYTNLGWKAGYRREIISGLMGSGIGEGSLGWLLEETPPAAGKNAPASKKLELDDIATQVVKAFAAPRTFEPSKCKPEVLERIVRPDQYDPLSFVPSRAVLQRAAECGEQLVADLPDDLLDPKYSPLQRTAAEMVRLWSASPSWVKTTHEDGWMMVVPRNAVASRQTRMDRKALASLISSSVTRGQPTLDDASSFAAAQNEVDPGAALVFHLPAFASNLFPQFELEPVRVWRSLQFYGLLSYQQRQALGPGGQLPFNTLSSQQWDLVNDMVYGLSRSVVQDPSTAPTRKRARPFTSEPTLLFPDGLPRNGYLTLAATSKPIAKYVPAVGPKPDPLARYRVGQETNLRFTFHLQPGAATTFTLKDSFFSKGAPALVADQLPPELHDRTAGPTLGGIRRPPPPSN